MGINPSQIGLWTTALIGAGTVIAKVVRFAFWLIDEVRKRRAETSSGSIPRETLRIAPKQENSYWWHMGGIGNDPAMQVVAEFFLTNVSLEPVRVLQIELRYGFVGRKKVNGMVLVDGPRNIYGFHDIEPGATADASSMFWIVPPVRKANESFRAHSVVFHDQFGNRHRRRGIRFRYT